MSHASVRNPWCVGSLVSDPRWTPVQDPLEDSLSVLGHVLQLHLQTTSLHLVH